MLGREFSSAHTPTMPPGLNWIPPGVSTPFPSCFAGVSSSVPRWPMKSRSSTAPGVPLCVSVLAMTPRRYGLTPSRSSSFRPVSRTPRTKSFREKQPKRDTPPPPVPSPQSMNVRGSFSNSHCSSDAPITPERPFMHSESPLCW